MVSEECAEAAVARGGRSVPDVGFGDHAAADAGSGGDRRYSEFLQRFPTLRALALAREEEVLAVWSGLGYYRRARMLHRRRSSLAGAGGRAAADSAGAAHAAGHWRVHGGGDCEHRVWREHRGSGWQCGARAAAGDGAAGEGRGERAFVQTRRRRWFRGGRWRAGECLGRSQPGDDGAGRDDLSAEGTALLCSVRCIRFARRAESM